MSALDELSASTTASLQALFGELGLESAEQQALLRALSDSVRDVFASAVTAQQSRAAAAEDRHDRTPAGAGRRAPERRRLPRRL